jgi:hypothetical protein
MNKFSFASRHIPLLLAWPLVCVFLGALLWCVALSKILRERFLLEIPSRTPC